MIINTDIDIDFADRDHALSGIHHIRAKLKNKNGQIIKHPSGVYFQNVPINPLDQLCAFDYDAAENLGYFKLDFLNQSVYQDIKDEDHLYRLLVMEPLWELLDEPALVSQLTHIHNHYDIVQSIKPTSINDLAIVLALIRPAKRYLLGKPREIIDSQIWNNDGVIEDGYKFKRAHAISYATLIVVQMNFILEQMSLSTDSDDSFIFDA